MAHKETARRLARLLDAAADIGEDKSRDALSVIATYLNPLVVPPPDDGPSKRSMKWHGLTIHIEHNKGDIRHGRKLPAAYGYIAATHALDEEGIDVFVGPEPNNDKNDVYVIRQLGGNNFDTYDEDKVMIGFRSWADATEAFKQAQEEKRYGGTAWFSIGDFVRAVKETKNVPQPVGGFSRYNPAMMKRPDVALLVDVGKQLKQLFGVDPSQPTNEQLDAGVRLAEDQAPLKEENEPWC